MKPTLITLAALSLSAASPAQELTKLTAADAKAGDSYGTALALAGDTLLVGCINDDIPASNSGSVYVYVASGSSWSQQARLVASDGYNSDGLGGSVALSGDTAVAGASFDDLVDGSLDDEGSAYVFVRSGTSWSEQAKLVAGDPGIGDLFGSAVGIDADVVAVGAPLDDDAGKDSGSVYVFTRSGALWTQQAKLTASDGAAGSLFGASLALDGDTLVVGAPRADGATAGSGAAYVFGWDGLSWSEQAKLSAGDAATGDAFGRSVALDGEAALVGAFQDDDGGVNAGSAYVFRRSGGTWGQEDKLTAAAGAALDGLGYAVALQGDLAVVGAHGTSAAGAGSGSVHAFVRSGSTWSEGGSWAASDAARADFLGACVALSDGVAAAGSPGDDDAGFSSGSAHLFWAPAGALGFCSSKESSIPGCAPSVSAPGPVVSMSGGPGSFDLTCAPIPGGNKIGIYIYSKEALKVVPAATGFGLLCISDIRRGKATLGGGTSGACDGSLTWDLGGQLASLSGLQAGDLAGFQCWYRDPPSAPAGANFSAGLRVLILP